MGFTASENHILELARQVWVQHRDASNLIRKYGPMSAEGWFTVELMVLLDKETSDLKKSQGKKGDKNRDGDIIVKGEKIEIRALTDSKYKHIIRGWKQGINFLLFGGIINEKAEKKLCGERGWEVKFVRISDDVAVGLLKKTGKTVP